MTFRITKSRICLRWCYNMNSFKTFFMRTKRRQILIFVLLFISILCYFSKRDSTTYMHFDNKFELKRHIERTLEEGLKEDKGSGCDIPKLDPFAKEVMEFSKDMGPITCPGKDWVKCHMSKCSVIPEILEKMPEVRCVYRDIIYVNDNHWILGPHVVLDGKMTYELTASDFVKIRCYGQHQGFFSTLLGPKWLGHGVGFRSSVYPKTPPPGREKTVNVLILCFDSTSRNGFMRNMPKSYKVLTEELGATVLNGYNIVGDGTPAALFPILTGKTELELPETRKSIPNSRPVDQIPFIFYKLKQDGYRTAFFEDSPHIGTFQYRLNGFRNQPTDHYLRAFNLDVQPDKNRGLDFCIGATPNFKIMLNITDQFMKLDGKRFIFTFIADICHDDFNYIGSADEPTADFLRGLKTQGILNDTLLFVMGDHGPRYAKLRNTLQGKLEERLPMMAVRVPEVLKTKRPEVQKNLELNADALTTPHDIYATMLDAIDMRRHWNKYKVKGADLTRGLSLLEEIPHNRSCSEAAIEPHWCTCFKWEYLPISDPLYRRLGLTLVHHINFITESIRDQCMYRELTTIHWVMKKKANTDFLRFKESDSDGYISKFGSATKVTKDVYQIKATLGPGTGVYEAAITYLIKEDKLVVNTRDISRTNAFNDEPSCVSETYPHLNMFCFCRSALERLKESKGVLP